MRASGVNDIITRMECRMRMYSRQCAHDREQAMRNDEF
jgi:hypothetical protein